jgi:hypothetical protein
MRAKIITFFARMFRQPSMDWQDEQYLNAAQNTADLEYRQRQLLYGLTNRRYR